MNDPTTLRQCRPPPLRLQTPQSGNAPARVRGCAPLRDPAGLQTSPSASSHGESLTASSSSVGSTSVTSRLMNNVRRSLSYSAGAKKRDSGLAVSYLSIFFFTPDVVSDVLALSLTTMASTTQDVGMQSTPEESLTPTDLHARARPYAYDYYGYDGTRAVSPTIEQIAMGLHTSRTPHLGPARSYGPSRSRSRRRGTPEGGRSVSPPPTRARPSHHRRDSAPVLLSPQPSSLKSPSKPGFTQPIPPTPSDSNVSLSTITTSTAPSTPQSTASGQSSMAHFSTRLQQRMSKLLPGKRNPLSPIATAVSSDDDSATSELTPRKVVHFSALDPAAERR